MIQKVCIIATLVSSSQQVQSKSPFSEVNTHHASVPYVEGQRQSPIDIKTTDFDNGLTVNEDPDFSINVGKLGADTMKVISNTALEFEFEGYFYDRHYTSSLPRLWYPDLEEPMTFTPKQVHFHMGTGTPENPGKGSEHNIDGSPHDLEMHIVNINKDEGTQDKFKAAVIGFLFDVVPDSKPNSFADDFFENLMNHDISDKMDMQTSFLKHVNFNDRFMYRGSLTTPPFAELLFWTVIPEIIPIKQSTKDLFMWSEHVNTAGYQKDHPAPGAENRDLQPLNGRRVYKLEISQSPFLMVLRNMVILLVLLAAGLIKFKIMNDNQVGQSNNNDDDDFHKYKLNDQELSGEKVSSKDSTDKSNNKTPMTVKEHNQVLIQDDLQSNQTPLNRSVGNFDNTPMNLEEGQEAFNGFTFPSPDMEGQNEFRRTSTIDFTKFSLAGSRRASINITGEGGIEKNYDHMDQSFHFDNIPEDQMEESIKIKVNQKIEKLMTPKRK